MNLRLNNFECNGFIFNSNFDSGNLAKVELIRKGGEFVLEKLNAQSNGLPFISLNAGQSHESSSSPTNPAPPSKQVDVEFNLSTKHDCGGTPFENTNRTWFYFSIRGGEKNQLVKFNVLNLNKQAKLFSQGMHPVVKHGNNGKWERIKDKPTFYVTEENFVLSFLHRTHDNVDDNLTYYAFTYPFTYKEQMDAIEGYEKKFGKTDDELSLIAREMSAPKKDRLVIKINDKLNFKGGGNEQSLTNENVMGDTLDELEATASSFDDAKQAFKILEGSSEKEMFDVLTENASDEINFNEFMKIKSGSKMHPSNSNVIDENTSESMQQITNLVNNVKIELASSTASILESTGAINNAVRAFQLQDIRQNIDEIRDDIYFYRELLINSYEGKRVDLITITSFQGMEEKREERLKNLFPDYSKPRCHTFKDKKIIFISSRVHPGETPASFVLNGFINLLLDRKSQIAIILRKMYVFKIIPLLNPDGVFNGLYRSDTLGHNLNRVYLNPRLDTQPSIYAARKLIRFYHFGYDKPDEYDETGELINGAGDGKTDIIMPSTCNDSDDDENFEQQEQKIEIEELETIEQNCEFDQLNVEPKIIEDTEMPTENNNETQEDSTDNCENVVVVKASSSSDQKPLQRKREKLEKSSSKSDSEKLSTGRPKISKSGNGSSKEKKLSSSKSSEAMKSRQNTLNNSLNAHGNRSHHHHHYKHQISHYNADKQQKMIQQQYFSQQPHQGLNISLDFLLQTDEKGEKCIVEEKSNLFLYLDLHGHASKKGVFMYGNHLPNTHEAVECMLLPRLMSMNCHHFHFDACNFSERNMYLRGKRDGLSKEGSGRVAIYKTTGLIKSYTLESNYNMAKCVNVLPPKGKEQSCKVLNLIPPKFCPAIFEEVGRALGPSILDLTNSNPVSRLMNSEFRTLQGLRNALRNEISRGLSKARVNKKKKSPPPFEIEYDYAYRFWYQDLLGY